MLAQTCKVLSGMLSFGMAAISIWQIFSQNILADVMRWVGAGGVEHISLFGGGYDVSARLFACVVVMLPIVFAGCGIWLMSSAFRARHEDAV